MQDDKPPTYTTDILVAGGKVYRVCAGCGDIIRVNKPFIGSMHLCATEDEQKRLSAKIRARAMRNLAALMNARQA